MIWSVHQLEPWKPARVYDAHGIEITHVIWMDTETGEVEQLAVDRTGRFISTEDKKDLETVRSFRPAPLKVVEMAEATA